MNVGDVRKIYRGIAERAHERAPHEWIYIAVLWSKWDAKLATFDDETVIDRPYLDHLMRNATHSNLSTNAILEWLDAYPDAVVDRLPGGRFADIADRMLV